MFEIVLEIVIASIVSATITVLYLNNRIENKINKLKIENRILRTMIGTLEVDLRSLESRIEYLEASTTRLNNGEGIFSLGISQGYAREESIVA